MFLKLIPVSTETIPVVIPESRLIIKLDSEVMRIHHNYQRAIHKIQLERVLLNLKQE